MSRFWQIICGALLVLVLLLCALPRAQSYDGPPLWARWAYLGLCSGAMAVAWAICFRRQVEQLRPTLFSLFVLLLMQAMLIWYAVTMNSSRWLGG